MAQLHRYSSDMLFKHVRVVNMQYGLLWIIHACFRIICLEDWCLLKRYNYGYFLGFSMHIDLFICLPTATRLRCNDQSISSH